ncbi:MAG: M20/M25/M40 family metallo-hydrolase, partial [Actinobacteria bacterium]|nr:M20/M25/M40 family metallo-hydrolase [Actinomycetota bacterium]
MTPDLEVLAQQWLSELREELPGAIELRHRLHADPRLSGDECDTAAAVAQAIGIEFETVAGCGGWARIGPGEGDAVAVRGELDALPGTERTGASFAASEGAVHACGHDVHLAALTALARAAARVNLPAGLVLLLQPREEKYPSGAEDIARAGVLTAQ